MFEDSERVGTYADGPPRFTPGFFDVHRMVGVLIRERAPKDARILIHGAGGGLEIESMARANPDWHFAGIDPAKPMLHAAEARLGPLIDRVELHHGFIDNAPAGPFDAATSLLTLHFLEIEERIETVSKIAQRLTRGAPLVVVHSSFPQADGERETWLSRYEAFAIASGVDTETAHNARKAVSASSTMLEPDQDLQILRDAGLSDVTAFYTSFTWRGWVGYVP